MPEHLRKESKNEERLGKSGSTRNNELDNHLNNSRRVEKAERRKLEQKAKLKLEINERMKRHKAYKARKLWYKLK